MYAYSVAKSVAGSVKKAPGASTRSFSRHRNENGFFTLRQTHFFTRASYAQVENYSFVLRTGGAIPMADQQQVDLLRQGAPEAWNRWRLDNPDRRPELQWADLNRVNLGDMDLSDADLTNASLIDADLNHANLSQANLAGASLVGANLAGANLYRAYLSGANLIGADLSGADLNEANLIGTAVRGANFSLSNVSQAIITPGQLKLARQSSDDV
jgi:uncharacterized protein YjbI with pentapeptide repeats